MPRLLGLGGYQESGKDAFADFLPKDEWDVLGMSTPLMRAAMAIDPYLEDVGMPLSALNEELNGDYAAAKSRSHSYRDFLRRLGTEVGRNMIGENVWVDIAKNSIRESFANGKNVAITGVRFPNELEMIHDMGGVLMWVVRNGVTTTSATHASETSVGPEDFDVLIQNDSTLDALREKALRVSEGLTSLAV